MSDDSLFREVDEEVRQEQYKRLWQRYGNILVGMAFIVILGVSGYEGWRYWQEKQSEAAGDSFFAAAGLAAEGKAEEAVKSFEAIGKTGFVELAKLRQAAVLAGEGKAEEAVAMYDAISADASLSQSLRDLSRIRAAAALADKASFADIETRLGDLAAAGNPWRHVAREIMAAAQFRLRDYKGAEAQVQAILADPETPPALRQRANTMAQLLAPMVTAQ